MRIDVLLDGKRLEELKIFDELFVQEEEIWNVSKNEISNGNGSREILSEVSENEIRSDLWEVDAGKSKKRGFKSVSNLVQ